MEPCRHNNKSVQAELCLDVSPYAKAAGFTRLNKRQRRVDAARSGSLGRSWDKTTSEGLFEDPRAFPGPLILPDDDLAIDPDEEPQSFREWHDLEARNPVTQERRTIYVVPSPDIDQGVIKMRTWSDHQSPRSQDWIAGTSPPDMKQFQEYLSAFYHGMEVKISEQRFTWQTFEEHPPKGKKQRRSNSTYDGTPLDTDKERLVGLRTPGDEVFGVRCRRSPDGVSRMQVNLDDILDALLANVPEDAFAIIMLVREDIWEGDDDIFVGGRAYGGSRIAVISAFRDDGAVSSFDNADHGWPLSHCSAFVQDACLRAGLSHKRQSKSNKADQSDGPMRAAFESVAPETARSPKTHWLACIAQTMAHELGHCFGLGHCVYFACMMQGSASSAEAYRQPPYLCPVCLEKVSDSIGDLIDGWNGPGSLKVRKKYALERYKALRAFCQRYAGSRVFTGYEAWLGKVIELEGSD